MSSLRAAGGVAFIITLFGLTGCAPMQWQKPGADATVSVRELDACRQQARTSSYQEMSTRLSVQPYGMGMDRAVAPSFSADGDRAVLEQHFFQMCMRSKGYELKPVERSAQQ